MQRISMTQTAAGIGRLLAIAALGIALSGCSKCQDWRIFGQTDAGLDACKSDALPRQQ